MRQISDKDVSKLSSLVVTLQQLLDRLESRSVVVTPEQQARIDECKENRVCLVCGHPLIDERDTRRGTTHQSCYNAILNRIKRGEITEQQAVDEGKWNPIAEKPGRKGKYANPARVKSMVGSARAKEKAVKAGTRGGTKKP